MTDLWNFTCKFYFGPRVFVRRLLRGNCQKKYFFIFRFWSGCLGDVTQSTVVHYDGAFVHCPFKIKYLFDLIISQHWTSLCESRTHSCQINKASNRQILEKKIVKIVKDVHGNRRKKIGTKMKYTKLKVKKKIVVKHIKLS